MTSNPFSPPNAIDLANAPWITPCPACTRNCTPTNVAYARLEKTENMLLKNPPNDPSTRFSRVAPTRNPSATATATPTTTQAFVVVSGPRHTASTAMPESSVSTIDIPGIRATRLGASRSSNHGAAMSPGRNARKNSPRSDAERVERVRQRARVVLEPGLLGDRGGLGAIDHVLRRRVEPVALEHVRVGADLDRVLQRRLQALLLDVVGALRGPVAEPLVVLADQEHDGVFGIVAQSRLDLIEVLLGRVVVSLARAGGALAGEEVLGGPQVRGVVLDHVAGDPGAEHVRERLDPAVRRVGPGLVVGVVVVHHEDARTRTGVGHHLVDGRERRAHTLVGPLVPLADPAVRQAVVEHPPDRAEDHDHPEHAGDALRSVAPQAPADRDERTESGERHRRRARVHEPVVRDDGRREHRERSEERQHPPDRGLVVRMGRTSFAASHQDRRDDRDDHERADDQRLQRHHPLAQA